MKIDKIYETLIKHLSTNVSEGLLSVTKVTKIFVHVVTRFRCVCPYK